MVDFIFVRAHSFIAFVCLNILHIAFPILLDMFLFTLRDGILLIPVFRTELNSACVTIGGTISSISTFQQR